MKRLGTAATLATLIAGLVLAGTGAFADTPLQRRAVVPQLAADSAPTLPPSPSPTQAALQCGEERWAVKTLSDPSATAVNFAPQASTVDGLRALLKPSVGQNTPRISPNEFQAYTIPVALVRMKLEDDRDIHLVVADTISGNTMIVEFPDVACEGAIDSAKKAEMQSARATFTAACGNPSASSFKNLSGFATLTGVAFFDILHGQSGVAPNGVELHPVLAVFNITCSAGSSGTATATPTVTPTATPTTTPTQTSSYQVPGCYRAGQNNCNCSDFTTHSWAQWFHDTYDPTDINKLDADHDGVVCESLPG